MLTYLIGGYITLRLYKGIRFYIIKKRAKKPSKLMKGAEPFLLHGNKTGIILIHGFSGSPYQYKHLSKKLYDKGYTVFAPLLPGHGTSSEKLMLVKWQDYFEKIEQDIDYLSNLCDEIFVIGTSFGGNIALSTSKNKRVKGIIVGGTPIIFKKYPFSRTMLALMNTFKIHVRKNYDKYAERIKVRETGVGYHSIPVSSLYHFIKAVKYSKTLIKNIKVPIFIIHSKTDTGVSLKSVDYIYKNSKSKVKKVMLVEDSYHNVFLDKDKEKISKEIIKFIEENKK